MAQYMAKWGNKGFLVSPTKIVPLLGISTGFARKADSNNDTSGKPTTNTRGLELQKISLTTQYFAAVGVDPRAQVEDWKNQFGKRYPLFINGKQFGPDLLELESVDISNIVTDDYGRFLQVDMTINLEEYVPASTTVSIKNKDTGSGSGSGSRSGGGSSSSSSKSSKSSSKSAARTGTKKGALVAKPSASAKNALKQLK